jgi:chromosome segregation ATPase
MERKKYPLDPLLKLRERQVDAATQKLAEAVGARQAAEKKREAAEAAKAKAEDRARELREKERDALEKGGLRAGDLHAGRAWEFAVEEERRRLAQQVDAASQGEKKARDTERGAQHDLASREADAEVVDQDKERFETKRKQAELAKEEEAANEAWRPKR